MILEKYVQLQLLMRDFVQDKSGVTAIEYALVGVSVAVIVGLVFGEDGNLQTALERGMLSIRQAMTN
ncbi:hypothetical protein VII00023_13832 [Vibrio ichthyoenteri ATCC 700023]|uniref:Flp/Fap pilin component n=1 Tax=Vibrio ichthyoenteri ATCC 700023 TaxID=870968 RepID=F9RWY0_9VIBR|nr:Flp family type IVb pilin [Vibrio ichthyoenteri]EGU48894.1 hypothetical protein VII00023_13832 [Vibrio ichthyoenteri ATCC 700023]